MDIEQLNLKFTEDGVLFDSVVRLNKLVALSLLGTKVNLLSGDYNATPMTMFGSVAVKGDENTPSVLATRRVLLNGDTMFMPDVFQYNTFDVIYIDVVSASTISMARTNMTSNLAVSSGTVVFSLFENKWMYISQI